MSRFCAASLTALKLFWKHVPQTKISTRDPQEPLRKLIIEALFEPLATLLIGDKNG